jgi:hypothetical protein
MATALQSSLKSEVGTSYRPSNGPIIMSRYSLPLVHCLLLLELTPLAAVLVYV